MGKYICLTALLFASQQVLAAETFAYMSGNKLLDVCTKDTPAHVALCLGYINGVVDIMSSNPVNEFRACLPRKNAPLTQMVSVAKKWLEAHPEALHYPAPGLVANAMAEAFPCAAQ